MMKVTITRLASYKVFLDKDSKIIGYQLGDSILNELDIPADVFPKDPPADTEGIITLDNLYSRITYEREKIGDENTKLLEYEIHSLADLRRRVEIEVKKITENGKTCLAYDPISGISTDVVRHCNNCEHVSVCLAS